jgi:hypothetical protein
MIAEPAVTCHASSAISWKRLAGKPEGRREAFLRKAELQLAEERIRHELKIPDTP